MFPNISFKNESPFMPDLDAKEFDPRGCCCTVDQSLSAEFNLEFGHIKNDLSTLLQPHDASEYLAKIERLAVSRGVDGFDLSTPVEDIYNSITPSNLQTPSELQHFSRVYSDRILPKLTARLQARQAASKKVQAPAAVTEPEPSA